MTDNHQDHEATVLTDATVDEVAELRQRLDRLERPDPTIERADQQARERAERMVEKREQQKQGARRGRRLRAGRTVDQRLGEIETNVGKLEDALAELTRAETGSERTDRTPIQARLQLLAREIRDLEEGLSE